MAGGDDSLGNRGDLLGSFALAEDDFWEALPDAAMVVDPRKPEILERRLAQILKELVVRGLRRKRSRLHFDPAAPGAEDGS